MRWSPSPALWSCWISVLMKSKPFRTSGSCPTWLRTTYPATMWAIRRWGTSLDCANSNFCTTAILPRTLMILVSVGTFSDGWWTETWCSINGNVEGTWKVSNNKIIPKRRDGSTQLIINQYIFDLRLDFLSWMSLPSLQNLDIKSYFFCIKNDLKIFGKARKSLNWCEPCISLVTYLYKQQFLLTMVIGNLVNCLMTLAILDCPYNVSEQLRTYETCMQLSSKLEFQSNLSKYALPAGLAALLVLVLLAYSYNKQRKRKRRLRRKLALEMKSEKDSKKGAILWTTQPKNSISNLICIYFAAECVLFIEFYTS